MIRWLVVCFGVVALAVPVSVLATGGPPLLVAKCGDAAGIAAKPFLLATEDGVHLYAIDAGSGSVAVVLVHESPGDLCGWLPYIPSLTAAGLRVLAFDLRGFGNSGHPEAATAYSRDLRAAIAHVRADGATHVFLVGASFGGAVVLTYAPSLTIDGVISLSGETYLPSARANPLRSIRHLHAPLLIVGSRRDRALPIPDALTLLRRAPTKDKHTAFYGGGWHGWAIVENAPYAPKARALILKWIKIRSS